MGMNEPQWVRQNGLEFAHMEVPEYNNVTRIQQKVS